MFDASCDPSSARQLKYGLFTYRQVSLASRRHLSFWDSTQEIFYISRWPVLCSRSSCKLRRARRKRSTMTETLPHSISEFRLHLASCSCLEVDSRVHSVPTR